MLPLRNLFMSSIFLIFYKIHYLWQSPKDISIFCIEQKTLSNDKVYLAFFSNRRYFIFESISFLQVRLSDIENSCNICSFISLSGMEQFIFDKAYFVRETFKLHELILSFFVIWNLLPILILVFFEWFCWSLLTALLSYRQALNLILVRTGCYCPLSNDPDFVY